MEYIEIYNDDVYDLLVDANDISLKKTKNMRLNKKIKFSIIPNGDINFKNLTKIKINNCIDAMKMMVVGDKRKSVSPTRMNAQSSRSHCICTISYENKYNEMKLNLVDLAGTTKSVRT
ncbi:kinesin-like protein subito [Melanaphis sacchari]|uniref:kinesin-like protein subito n=1 Tax=Melanaphis sacchari TaxID=742174 RepID=UPI000DC14ED4|nr:kinesin-like protein subito [Melanaphis sacchari]